MYNIHVVIPVYNVEKYVEQAVRSVLDQPYKGIDIVLVDDGSPDNSPAICDRLAEECDRVHVIHKENGGLSSARNAGIEFFLKKYDDGYIAFLDSDDMWVPDFFNCSAEELLFDVDVAIFSFYYSNHAVTRLRAFDLKKNGYISHPAKDTLWDYTVYAWNRFYKVALLKKHNIRFQPNVRVGEDVCFNNVVQFYAKDYYCSDRYMYVYRNNPSSIVNTAKKIKVTPWLYQINGLIEGLELFKIKDEKYVKKTIDYVCWYIIEFAENYYMLFSLDDLPYEEIEKLTIKEWFKNNKTGLSQNDSKRIDLMINHRIKFKIKFFCKGFVRWAKEMLIKIRPINEYVEVKKYPVVATDIFANR